MVLLQAWERLSVYMPRAFFVSYSSDITSDVNLWCFKIYVAPMCPTFWAKCCVSYVFQALTLLTCGVSGTCHTHLSHVIYNLYHTCNFYNYNLSHISGLCPLQHGRSLNIYFCLQHWIGLTMKYLCFLLDRNRRRNLGKGE